MLLPSTVTVVGVRERPRLERAPFERAAQRKTAEGRAVWESCAAARDTQRQLLCCCFGLPGTAGWQEVKAADEERPGSIRWNSQYSKYFKR